MKNQANILVIEDDKELRETLLKILNREGYSTDGVSCSKDALELTNNKQFDLIVCDVRLPGGKDGLETIKNIKDNSLYDSAKVIIITGYADIEVPVRAIKEHVDDYIWKPFELKDFINVVKNNIKKNYVIREADEKKKGKARYENIIKVEKFIGSKFPHCLREKYKSYEKYVTLDQEQIQKAVDFEPPFLHTEKLVIFGEKLEESSSIGVGKIYPKDTVGHYNKTIYLALAGKLMPSTATIHLGYFHPNTSPQAVEGKSIRMDRNALNNGLLQPSEEGTTFYVETIINKKKMRLVLCDTYIMFGQSKFGLIEELRFILTEKESIYSAVKAPEVI